MGEIENAQDRSNAKIRYARLHLEELRVYPIKGSGDDFERSHQESFLYHLFGARDSFLQELNLYYRCGLPPDKVRVDSIRRNLNKRGLSSLELNEITQLEDLQGSWLNDAKEMRDHATHRRSIPRSLYIGGPEDGQVHLKNPRSGQNTEQDYLPLFEDWCKEMEQLLNRLRGTALATYKSNNPLQADAGA